MFISIRIVSVCRFAVLVHILLVFPSSCFYVVCRESSIFTFGRQRFASDTERVFTIPAPTPSPRFKIQQHQLYSRRRFCRLRRLNYVPQLAKKWVSFCWKGKLKNKLFTNKQILSSWTRNWPLFVLWKFLSFKIHSTSFLRCAWIKIFLPLGNPQASLQKAASLMNWRRISIKELNCFLFIRTELMHEKIRSNEKRTNKVFCIMTGIFLTILRFFAKFRLFLISITTFLTA